MLSIKALPFLYMMYDSYGGYGGYEEEKKGIGSAIASLLSSFPEPVANLIICIAVLGIAAVVGLIAARIAGSIFYPDPEKPSILSKKQKLIFLGGFCAAFAIIIFSLTYTPKIPGESLEVDNPSVNGEYDSEFGTEFDPDGENDYLPDGEEEDFQPDETEKENPTPGISGGGVTVKPSPRMATARAVEVPAQ